MSRKRALPSALGMKRAPKTTPQGPRSSKAARRRPWQSQGAARDRLKNRVERKAVCGTCRNTTWRGGGVVRPTKTGGGTKRCTNRGAGRGGAGTRMGAARCASGGGMRRLGPGSSSFSSNFAVAWREAGGGLGAGCWAACGAVGGFFAPAFGATAFGAADLGLATGPGANGGGEEADSGRAETVSTASGGAAGDARDAVSDAGAGAVLAPPAGGEEPVLVPLSADVPC